MEDSTVKRSLKHLANPLPHIFWSRIPYILVIFELLRDIISRWSSNQHRVSPLNWEAHAWLAIRAIHSVIFHDRQISFNSQNATITAKTSSSREKWLFTSVKFFWSNFFLIPTVLLTLPWIKYIKMRYCINFYKFFYKQKQLWSCTWLYYSTVLRKR